MGAVAAMVVGAAEQARVSSHMGSGGSGGSGSGGGAEQHLHATEMILSDPAQVELLLEMLPRDFPGLDVIYGDTESVMVTKDDDDVSPANAALIRRYMMTSLNAAGLAAAIASFEEESFKSFSKGKITEAREMITASAKSAGLELLTPSANFVFVKVADANAVQKAMAAKGVMIRGAYGKWTQWSRVSTGRIEDVARYCKVLPEAVGA